MKKSYFRKYNQAYLAIIMGQEFVLAFNEHDIQYAGFFPRVNPGNWKKYNLRNGE